MTEPEPAPTPVPLAEREPGPASLLLRMGLVLLTPMVALLVLALQPRRFDLWVDNGGDAPLVIQVEGRTQELAPRSSLCLEGLDGGQVTLVWREGKEEHRTTATIPVELFAPRAAWVWNVGDRTPRYWVVSRGYGTAVAPRPRRLEGGSGVWRVPDELLPGLDVPFPEQVKSRGAPGAVRSVAWSEHHASTVGPARLRLYVDPGVMVPVRLRIDGREVATIPPGRRFRFDELSAGPHLLEATVLDANGRDGQSAVIDAVLEAEPLAPPTGWVWMPFQPQTYWVVAHALGEVQEALPPNRRFVPPAALFRIPAGVQPGLDELPLEAQIAPGSRGVVVLGLWSAEALRNAIPRLDPNQLDLNPPGAGPPGMGGG